MQESRIALHGPVSTAAFFSLKEDFRRFFLEICEVGPKEAEKMFGYLEEAARQAIQNKVSYLFFSGIFNGNERQIFVDFETNCYFMFAPPPAVRVSDTRLLLETATLGKEKGKNNKLRLCFKVLTEEEFKGERAV